MPFTNASTSLTAHCPFSSSTATSISTHLSAPHCSNASCKLYSTPLYLPSPCSSNTAHWWRRRVSSLLLLFRNSFTKKTFQDIQLSLVNQQIPVLQHADAYISVGGTFCGTASWSGWQYLAISARHATAAFQPLSRLRSTCCPIRAPVHKELFCEPVFTQAWTAIRFTRHVNWQFGCGWAEAPEFKT